MFLPDDPSAVAGQYIDGVPGGAHGTALRADQMNAIVNEIANVVTASGAALAKADSAQLLAAIRALGGRGVELVAITSWRDLYVSPTAINMNAIAASPLGVLAVGRAASPVPMRFLAKNSDSWETVTPAATFPGTFSDVCWSTAFARFVAVGFDVGGATNEIQDSPSAASGSWTNRPLAGGSLYACAAGATADVAVGASGLIGSTTNGTAWTARTSAHPGIAMNGVAYSPTLNRFVAVGAGGKIQRSDATGTTWAAATSPTANAFMDQGITWSGEHALFFAWTTSDVYKSADGLTWTLATGPIGVWPVGGTAKVVALPAHLAVFSNGKPPYAKMYPIAELDGTPANVVENLNLVAEVPDPGGFDSIMSVIRVPPASGYMFAGRLLTVYNSGRIRATPYIG